MLYLLADRDGRVSEVIEAENFSEAYKKVKENNAELVIELDEEILNEIEQKRSRYLKIVEFIDCRKREIWETEFFSGLSEDELQIATDNAVEELNKKTFMWTGKDIVRLLEKKRQVRTPRFSIERCKIYL